MKGKNIRRIRPQLTTGCMAMTFAVGFLTFTPVTSLASGGVNAITSIEQQQRISGTVKDGSVGKWWGKISFSGIFFFPLHDGREIPIPICRTGSAQ